MANGWAAWAPQFDFYGFQNYAIYPLQGGSPILAKGDALPDGSYVAKILKNIDNNNPQLEKIIIGENRMVGVNASDNVFVAKCKKDMSMCAFKCNICLIVVVEGQDSEPKQYNAKVIKIGKMLNGES